MVTGLLSEDNVGLPASGLTYLMSRLLDWRDDGRRHHASFVFVFFISAIFNWISHRKYRENIPVRKAVVTNIAISIPIPSPGDPR